MKQIKESEALLEELQKLKKEKEKLNSKEKQELEKEIDKFEKVYLRETSMRRTSIMIADISLIFALISILATSYVENRILFPFFVFLLLLSIGGYIVKLKEESKLAKTKAEIGGIFNNLVLVYQDNPMPYLIKNRMKPSGPSIRMFIPELNFPSRNELEKEILGISN